MADATPGTTAGTSVDAPAPQLTREDLLQIVMPEPGERVIVVPQCSSHLVSLAEDEGLVGLPASAIDDYISTQYGAPSWATWSGRYGRYELSIGSALLVIRDGILRKGPEHWDSGD